MSLESNLQTLVTDIGSQFKIVKTYISGSGTGNVSGLATTATDLVAAVNEVHSELDASVGAAVTSVNGQAGPGAVVISTTDIAEGTNLYFTDARSIASPLTGFTSGAGTVAAADSILQGIQKVDGNVVALTATVAGLTTDDVAEATALYYTDARVIAAPITGFTSGAGTLAATDTVLEAIQKLDGNLNASVGSVVTGVNGVNGPGAITIDTDDVGEGSTNLYYTDARSIAAPLTGYAAGAGTVSASDSVLQAIQKVDGNIGSLINDAASSTTTTYSSDKITTDINAAVAALVDSAPAALDTLNELAAAVADDAAFSTTVTTALGNRVRVDAAQTFSVGEKSQANTNLGLGATIETRDFAADFAAALT